MDNKIIQRSLAFIESCDDATKLRQLAVNAASKGVSEVERSARLRLYAILPSEQPGTLEYDVWQSIYCLEDTLGLERGKTTRLSRTRQKIARDGEQKTVADLVLGTPSDGFSMLIERRMPELTFEAVAIKHSDRFDEEVISAAKARLIKAGIPDSL
jgi:hypothetical protein